MRILFPDRFRFTKHSGRIRGCYLDMHGPVRADDLPKFAEIGKEIDLSRATVQRAIDTMKAAGIVSRQGSNNGGQWVIHWQ